jgi:hypothetical protein
MIVVDIESSKSSSPFIDLNLNIVHQLIFKKN